MYSIPQLHQFGKLELIEVYEFYDKPLLYSCKNTSSIFLVILVDEEDDFDTWLYRPISYNRFQQIRSGVIDLHDAFSKSAEAIFKVQIFYDDERQGYVKQIPVNSIREEWLPLPDERLDIQKAIPLSRRSALPSDVQHAYEFGYSSWMISQIAKSMLYAEEADRITFHSFQVIFSDDHKQHKITYNKGHWRCSCYYFDTHSICSHVITLEGLLAGAVTPAEGIPVIPVPAKRHLVPA